MYIKEFDKWNEIKKSLSNEETKIFIRKGDIRWVAFGVNVGSEIDGKDESFTRPALIVSVIGSHLAMVIPMSTKIKNIAGYYSITLHDDRTVSLCIHQAKVISTKRIFRRIEHLPSHKLDIIKNEMKRFFDL